jgi:hypothetical protein
MEAQLREAGLALKHEQARREVAEQLKTEAIAALKAAHRRAGDEMHDAEVRPTAPVVGTVMHAIERPI